LYSRARPARGSEEAGWYAQLKVDQRRTQQTRCKSCGRDVPDYNIINYGSIDAGYRQLCTKCFNTELAESGGLDSFAHAELEPVELTDCDGQAHVFHFRTRLFGPGVALDAFEVCDEDPAGYQFQVIGEPEDDPLELLARLIEKIRRALSIKHVTVGSLGLQIADHQVLRGRIEWDKAEEGRVPLLVVDGREITLDEFGRMLMAFEGWQFKLEIRDKSEEL
jgi:hypothetical protein